MDTDYGRNAQASCQDGRVGGGTAVLRDKADDALVQEQHGIGRGQIVGQNHLTGETAVRLLVMELVLPQQNALDTGNDMLDVIPARPKIGIVHFLEHADQCISLQLQRPFSIATSGPNQLDRGLGQRVRGNGRSLSSDAPE